MLSKNTKKTFNNYWYLTKFEVDFYKRFKKSNSAKVGIQIWHLKVEKLKLEWIRPSTEKVVSCSQFHQREFYAWKPFF